jgi:cytochrome c2
LILLAGAFLAGAFWAAKEVWPYKALRKAKTEAAKPDKPPAGRKTLATDNVALDLDTFYIDSQTPIQAYGGGIFAFDHEVLVMSFRGELYLYASSDGKKSVSRLDIGLDNGYDAFQEYVKANTLVLVDPERFFRFIDVLYERDAAQPYLLVSHHQWHPAQECFTLQLSALDLAPGVPLEQQTAAAEDWRAVYVAQPCLPVVANVQYFAGDQSGGRIVRDGPGSVLFTLGDHAFDGWTIPEAHPQDPDSDYGKILRVELGSGVATRVSIGHRNPQGLAIDRDGNIWSTEHGPRGGDELNLVREGADYGWPSVTFGSQYGMYEWPISTTQNRHDGYEQPILAWLPAIGVSNLIQVEDFMPEWEGDLLVGSLRDRSFHRIRLRDGHAVFDHRIDIDVRIRDIDRWADGTILLWTDDASIVEVRPGRADEPDLNALVAGLEPRQQRQALGIIGACLQCHGEALDAPGRIAPALDGIVGRKIAGTDFDGYSEALRNRGGTWNEQSLDDFLRDVDAFAPGSTMYFPGIEDDAIRSAVIDYLKALSVPP